MKHLSAMICGSLFGFALALSGMTDTNKVLGFLDIFGAWIPDLAYVMGGAVLVTVLLTRQVLKRQKPLFDKEFCLPQKTAIDSRLLLGAGCFGIGWGLYGYCPGPAIASLAYLNPGTYVFVATMLVGMAIANLVSRS